MRSKNNKPHWMLLIAGIFASTVSADDMLASFDGGGFELPEFDEFSVPVVLTATRIQQHQSDVPASVTILDADFIKKLGARNLIDLLRHVPGMMISPDRNNNADSVYYHGGPAAFAKNMQVLLNGRSMYRTGLASVSWYQMPVAIEDIRRIEVVRGPNSAAYGANAYQAVINILTKHPADTYGSTVSVTAGTNGENDAYLRQGGRVAGFDYRVSYTQKSTDWYEDYVDPEAGEDCSVGQIACRDDRESRFIDFELSKSIDGVGDLDISVVAAQAEKGIANPSDFQVSENRLLEDRYELGVSFTKDFSNKHQIQVKSYISQYNERRSADVAGVPLYLLDDELRELFTLNPDAANAIAGGNDPTSLLNDSAQVDLATSILTKYADPSYAVAPVSGTVHADIDEYRFDIEVQDTYVFSPELTIVSGMSYRHDKVSSQHHFSGELNNDTSRIFASATWVPFEQLSAHIGVMGEKEDRTDVVYAPRAALNYKLTPSQSMRLVYSESVRSPDLLEQSADWNFLVSNAQSAETLNGTTFYQTAQGPENLDHQLIQSYELGYYGRLATLDSEIDIRIFREELTDVIYQSIKLANLRSIEGNEITFDGVEWQFNSSPWQGTQFRLVGAHVDADWLISDEENLSSTTLLRIYARDTVTFAWMQNWAGNDRTSLSYMVANKYDQTNNAAGRNLFERLELYMGNALVVGDLDLEISVTLQHDMSTEPFIRSENVYENNTRAQLGLKASF